MPSQGQTLFVLRDAQVDEQNYALQFLTDCTLLHCNLLEKHDLSTPGCFPGWQAAVLLMSYFAVFTLNDCPQFNSMLGALSSAPTKHLRMRGLVSGPESALF